MKKIVPMALAILMFAMNVLAQKTTITGPAGSGQYGKTVVILSNGNYVVTDPLYDEGAIADVGAVYLYDGATHAQLSILKGSATGDQVGSGVIRALPNGNFVVSSPNWNNETLIKVGAVTWRNGTSIGTEIVSATNSLIGRSPNDQISSGSIIPLVNSNYVVRSPLWDNGNISDAGAATWGDGNIGTSGIVSINNSLVGTHAGDKVGEFSFGLSNGNYFVRSIRWHNGTAADAGAITWGDGKTGISGAVSESNSLVGSSTGDLVGSGFIALPNGNYVVISKDWDNGNIVNAGAATWVDGITGLSGFVSAANSLIGSSAGDAVGTSIRTLSNSNYVVSSPIWDNGSVADAGAVTWCDGNRGRVGMISAANSLVGSSTGDEVGRLVTLLSNENYVVQSSRWNNGNIMGAGAATLCNGVTGTTGVVSAANSLVGGNENDQVGFSVTALKNGNYTVNSKFWKNGAMATAGAVTWAEGNKGITGLVNSDNSIVGSTADDQIGQAVTALTNGNYVINSPLWDNGIVTNAGAATWGDGMSGIHGTVSNSNSLVGSSPDDMQEAQIIALTNGNYVVRSSLWDRGTIANAGAVTWSEGTSGITGTITASKSLLGSTANDYIGSSGILVLKNGNFAIMSPLYSRGAATNAGAITWANGFKGILGTISTLNSIVGKSSNDNVGGGLYTILEDGGYIVNTNKRIAGTSAAITLLGGSDETFGELNDCNSILDVEGSSNIRYTYNENYKYVLAGEYPANKVIIFDPSGQQLGIHLDEVTKNISGISRSSFVTNDCRIIATILPTGTTTAINGTVTAKEWIENTQPENFVKRHYEITPSSATTTATAKLTLYFTQSEFDDFNAVNAIKLPTNPSDAAGKANLLIEKYAGISSNGSGLPASYSSTPITIDPVDRDIVWNARTNRWEISFDVTGFSGFFVKTIPGPLPLKWISVSASVDNAGKALVNFQVQENSIEKYIVEKSFNGTNFTRFAVSKSKGDGKNSYSATDPGALYKIVYYRIQQVENTGKTSYSPIVKLATVPQGSITIYPNPVKNLAVVNSAKVGGKAFLIDASGKTLQQIKITASSFTIDMSGYNLGVYFLKMEDGQVLKILKD